MRLESLKRQPEAAVLVDMQDEIFAKKANDGDR